MKCTDNKVKHPAPRGGATCYAEVAFATQAESHGAFWRRRVGICIFLLLFLFKTQVEADLLSSKEVFSLDGQKKKVMLTGPDRKGISTLTTCLGKITSAEFPSAKDNGKISEDTICFHVGQDEYVKKLNLDLENMHPEGFYIRLVNQENIIIAGNVANGISCFLKKYCGYRWFGPGEFGEVIPKKDIIVLPAKIDLRKEPSFITCTGDDHAGGGYGINRNHLQATHNLYNIFPVKKYGTNHPEYYPFREAEGKRIVPAEGQTQCWQPCVSNPEVVQIAIKTAKDFFQKYPRSLGFSLGLNDGSGDCECPQCKASAQKYGNQYLPFFNQVARGIKQEYPDKLIGFTTYGGVYPPKDPKSFQLEPNLYMEANCGLANNFSKLQQWKIAGVKNFGVYEYYYSPGGYGYLAPYSYPHIIGNALKKAYYEYGVKGGWFETPTYMPYLVMPFRYVFSELTWDIDQDIDNLLEDYFSSFYQEAKAPVSNFFARLEECYNRKPDPQNPWAEWRKPTQFDWYALEDITYLESCLKEANKLSKTEAVQKRVNFLTKSFELCKLHIIANHKLKEIEKVKDVTIKDKSDIERYLDIFTKANSGVDEIENFKLESWEEKNIFSGTSLEGAKVVFRPSAYIEISAADFFEKITCFLEKEPWDKNKAFWLDIANKSAGVLKRVALAQIYIKENPEAKENIIPNPGFEKEIIEGVDIPPGAEKVDWTRVGDKKIPHWSYWKARTFKYGWDSQNVHSGKFSLLLHQAQDSGFWLKVKPDAMYKLSFWLKMDPPDKGLTYHLRWAVEEGWAGGSFGRVASLDRDIPGEKEIGWRKSEVVFTVPFNATYLVLHLTPASDQIIWLDDFSLNKIYDPDFLK